MYLLISDEASVLRILEKTRLAFKDSQISQNSFVRHDFQNIYIYIYMHTEFPTLANTFNILCSLFRDVHQIFIPFDKRQ